MSWYGRYIDSHKFSPSTGDPFVEHIRNILHSLKDETENGDEK